MKSTVSVSCKCIDLKKKKFIYFIFFMDVKHVTRKNTKGGYDLTEKADK